MQSDMFIWVEGVEMIMEKARNGLSGKLLDGDALASVINRRAARQIKINRLDRFAGSERGVSLPGCQKRFVDIVMENAAETLQIAA